MIYLASVYSLNANTNSEAHKALREARYLQVMEKSYEELIKGNFIFSPILHCHRMSNVHDMPKDFDFWEALDKDYIKHCSELWVYQMDGWEKSKGITAEIAYAKEIGLPIKYLGDN